MNCLMKLGIYIIIDILPKMIKNVSDFTHEIGYLIYKTEYPFIGMKYNMLLIQNMECLSIIMRSYIRISYGLLFTLK